MDKPIKDNKIVPKNSGGNSCSNAIENRNYGIDLLRLLLMFMVCMIHVLSQGGVLDACIPHSLEYNVFWFMKIAVYYAVDSFAFISGYKALNRKQNYSKVVNMWFQVLFYSVVLTLVLVFCGVSNTMDFKEIVRCVLPVTFKRYWYFTAYVGLFFVMPLLNKYLFALDSRNAKKIFILLVALFSCMGTVGDPFNLGSGFSCLWLIIVYSLGVLSNKINLFNEKSNFQLASMWLLSILITWIAVVSTGKIGFMAYTSPTILLCGIIMVIYFNRIKINGTFKKIVEKLSPLTFGIFLFQLNPIIYEDILHNRFSCIPRMHIILGVIAVLGLSLSIFGAGIIVEYVRVNIYTRLNINKISCKIVEQVDECLEKMGNLLN